MRANYFRTSLLLVVLASLLLPWKIAFANKGVEIVVDRQEFQQRVGKGVLIHEDVNSSLDIEQLLSAADQYEFSPFPHANLNLGYSESTFWIRIPIENRLDLAQMVSADLEYPLIDEVDFYVVEKGEVQSTLKTGDHFPLESKTFRLKNYLHRFTIPANSNQDLYIRVKTTSAFSIQLVISTEKMFVESLSVSQAFDAAYFGLAVGLMLYNLFLFFLIREKIYLEYTSFVFAYAFFAFCLSGYPQLVFSNMPLLTERGVYFFGVLSGLILTQFCRSYLLTDVGFPRADKIIKLYMIGIGMVFIYEILGPLNIVIKLNSLVIFGGSLVVLIMSIVRYQQGFGPAKYFVVGQGVVLLSVIFTTLSSQNIVPGYYMASTFIKLANGFELILFSIGLAARINLMKAREVELSKKAQVAEAEAHKAKDMALEQQRKLNESLEVLVEERTKQLQATLKDLEKSNKELEVLGETDGLTKLYNRRAFNEKIVNVWEESIRKQRSFSLLLIDADHFKSINDTKGHPCGDYVLVELAKIIKESASRPTDLAFRYGGEEFLLVLPNTEINGAIHVAEQLKRTTETHLMLWENESFNITISIGVHTSIMATSETVEMIVDSADQALYHSKNAGRNRWTLSQDLS